MKKYKELTEAEKKSVQKKFGQLLEYSFIEDYRSEWTVKYSHERYTMVGYEWDKNFGWRFRYYGAMLSYIEQLHQLQNIFYALMKVELQIKNI